MAALMALLVFQEHLPYGKVHLRNTETFILRGHLSVWKSSSAFPGNIESLVAGEHSKMGPFRTNFLYEGRAYSSIIRLDSGKLRGDGFLLGTTNAEVFWVSRNGTVRLMQPQTRK